MRNTILTAAILALTAPPAAAELTWQPEGRFFVRYGVPGQSHLPGEDANFELIDARLGARLSLLPDLSARAVGQALNTQDSRYPPVLRWGYLECRLPGIATLRAGQVPTPWSEEEDAIVGDPLIGPGVALASGFVAPGGLGASLSRQLPLALWGVGGGGTASLEIGGFYTEGLLGHGEMTPETVRPDIAGSGPAVAGRVSYQTPDGWSAHVFGRWGTVLDQQAGLATAWDGSGWHLVGEAIASASNPVYALATGETIHDALATDVAALVGARCNLGAWGPALGKVNLLGRLAAVLRNVTDTTRATDSDYPVEPSGANYTGDLAVVYAINDDSDVALDAQLLRQVLGSATQSISLGVRVGVQF